MYRIYFQISAYSAKVCDLSAKFFWTHYLDGNIHLLLPTGQITDPLNGSNELIEATEALDYQIHNCLIADFANEEERKDALTNLILAAIEYSCLFAVVSSLAIDEAKNESR
ncbi:MAG TPA: hypothetical protein DCY88_24915 [Cyanobacteria bacterium UBA11372]|nr:hypothetical protein [Cyanobacteria bacterium UBA11372]